MTEEYSIPQGKTRAVAKQPPDSWLEDGRYYLQEGQEVYIDGYVYGCGGVLAIVVTIPEGNIHTISINQLEVVL